jgi:hypothetical protein
MSQPPFQMPPMPPQTPARRPLPTEREFVLQYVFLRSQAITAPYISTQEQIAEARAAFKAIMELPHE